MSNHRLVTKVLRGGHAGQLGCPCSALRTSNLFWPPPCHRACDHGSLWKSEAAGTRILQPEPPMGRCHVPGHGLLPVGGL